MAAAYAVPLAVLPSSLWRIGLLLGLPFIGVDSDLYVDFSIADVIYILALSLVGMTAALLTLGLVQRWGEVLPRWLPLLGGRRVRPAFAVSVACLGAFLVLLISWQFLRGGAMLFDNAESGLETHFTASGQVLLIGTYLPFLAWGPLLLAVTWSYWRRTRVAVDAPRVDRAA